MSGYFLVFAALKLIITIACFGGFVIVNAYVHDIDLKSVLALCFVAFCLVVELILAFLFIRVRYVVAVLGTIAVICFVAFRESGMLLQ